MEQVLLVGGPFDGRIARVDPARQWAWFAATLVMPDEPPVRYRRYTGMRQYNMSVFGLDFEDLSVKGWSRG